jgi:hypothetical protein
MIGPSFTRARRLSSYCTALRRPVGETEINASLLQCYDYGREYLAPFQKFLPQSTQLLALWHLISVSPTGARKSAKTQSNCMQRKLLDLTPERPSSHIAWASVRVCERLDDWPDKKPTSRVCPEIRLLIRKRRLAVNLQNTGSGSLSAAAVDLWGFGLNTR